MKNYKKVEELKNVFEIGSLVTSFNHLNTNLLTNRDAIFHAGMLGFNQSELDNLCMDYHSNLTIYESNVYYFRFKNFDYYKNVKFGIEISDIDNSLKYLVSNIPYELEPHDDINFEQIKEMIDSINDVYDIQISECGNNKIICVNSDEDKNAYAIKLGEKFLFVICFDEDSEYSYITENQFNLHFHMIYNDEIQYNEQINQWYQID